jgi:conjugal transfer pilus assembly protein TraE
MNPQKISEDLETRLGISLLQLLLVGFMASTLLLALRLVTHQDKERVVVTPPLIDKSFWVERDDVDPGLVLNMGIFLAQLAYTVSPASVDFQSDAILKYASPEAYGALKEATSVAAARMHEDQSSTVFTPRAYLMDKRPGKKTVAFMGDLKTYVTTNLVSTRGVAIVVSFKYQNGRLYIDQMKETKQNDPFETNETNLVPRPL